MRYRFSYASVLLLAAAVGCAQQQPSWFQGMKSSNATFGPSAPDSSGGLLSVFKKKPGGAETPSLPPPKEVSPEAERRSQLAMARLYERRGELKLAKAVYEVSIKKNPNDPLPYHRLAVIAVRECQFEEAEKQFAKALSLGKPSAELYSDRGYAYYLQDRLPEAEKALQQALAVQPDYDAATNNLAIVRGAQRRYDESLVLFRRTCSEAEAHANMAYILAQNGEYERAEAAYSHALTLDGKLRAAAQGMVQIHQRRLAEKQLAAREPGRGAEAAPDGPVGGRRQAAPAVAFRPATDADDRAIRAVSGQYADDGTPPERPVMIEAACIDPE